MAAFETDLYVYVFFFLWLFFLSFFSFPFFSLLMMYIVLNLLTVSAFNSVRACLVQNNQSLDMSRT